MSVTSGRKRAKKGQWCIIPVLHDGNCTNVSVLHAIKHTFATATRCVDVGTCNNHMSITTRTHPLPYSQLFR
eukprot:1917978-Rhodomonas_salina.1